MRKVRSMGNTEFAYIGQFVISAFFFAIGTAALAMISTDAKTDKDWFPVAWGIGIVVYGVTFVILCNR